MSEKSQVSSVVFDNAYLMPLGCAVQGRFPVVLVGVQRDSDGNLIIYQVAPGHGD